MREKIKMRFFRNRRMDTKGSDTKGSDPKGRVFYRKARLSYIFKKLRKYLDLNMLSCSTHQITKNEDNC